MRTLRVQATARSPVFRSELMGHGDVQFCEQAHTTNIVSVGGQEVEIAILGLPIDDDL